jgi:hypothetical protein
MLGAQGLWAGRDFHRATPTGTRDLGLYGLIRKTGTHIPQRDSNPPTQGSSDLWAQRSNHCTISGFMTSIIISLIFHSKLCKMFRICINIILQIIVGLYWPESLHIL